MYVFRKQLFIIILFFTLSGLYAEKFEYRYIMGQSYRIRSVVEQEVYINGFLNHKAEILNRISVEVADVDNGAGLLKGNFVTSEQSVGQNSVYTWGENYYTEFWRDKHGVMDVPAQYFMPVVRSVPQFPDRDLEIGDTWSAMGEEVHDFRQGFGVAQPYRFPVYAHYEYTGKDTYKDIDCHVINVTYSVFHLAKNIQSQSGDYPERIFGTTKQKIYWDNRAGNALYYDEEYHIVLTLAGGDEFEFIGTAWAEILDLEDLDRNAIVNRVTDDIRRYNLQNMAVEEVEEGIKITFEDIRFHPNSAQLLPTEYNKVEQVARILKDYPNYDILIKGHTALAGTEEGRKVLSEERARTIAKLLINLEAREREAILIQGLGALEPKAENITEAGRAKNRRVEIIILEN